MNGLPEKKMSEDAQNVNLFTGTKRKENDIPYGYCKCGCCQKTTISPKSCRFHGYIKGKPRDFIQGHHARLQPKGENSHKWLGGVSSNGHNRIIIYNPSHPKATSEGYVLRYILIAEKAMGKILERKHQVHHFNGITDDDRNSNLVVCESNAYHFLLHQRQRAYQDCGNPHYIKCNYCKKYDDPSNLNGHHVHSECNKKYQKAYSRPRRLMAAKSKEKLRLKRIEIKKFVVGLHNNGLTTRDIADKLNMGNATISRILNGKGAWKVDPETLEARAKEEAF